MNRDLRSHFDSFLMFRFDLMNIRHLPMVVFALMSRVHRTLDDHKIKLFSFLFSLALIFNLKKKSFVFFNGGNCCREQITCWIFSSIFISVHLICFFFFASAINALLTIPPGQHVSGCCAVVRVTSCGITAFFDVYPREMNPKNMVTNKKITGEQKDHCIIRLNR